MPFRWAAQRRLPSLSVPACMDWNNVSYAVAALVPGAPCPAVLLQLVHVGGQQLSEAACVALSLDALLKQLSTLSTRPNHSRRPRRRCPLSPSLVHCDYCRPTHCQKSS